MFDGRYRVLVLYDELVVMNGTKFEHHRTLLLPVQCRFYLSNEPLKRRLKLLLLLLHTALFQFLFLKTIVQTHPALPVHLLTQTVQYRQIERENLTELTR
jgi:hypothetical protein